MKRSRKLTLPEPEVLKELHRVRRRIQRKAEKVGWQRYLEELNTRPSILSRSEPLVLKERPKKEYGSRG